MKLPDWSWISDKSDHQMDLDPLEKFIYENEPAGTDQGAKFREELREMIKFVAGEEWFDKDGA